MKQLVFSMAMLFATSALHAQQAYDPKKMVFVPTNKPNTIIYNDTIYKGSAQFRNLFYRTGDKDIIKLYQQHQSNKVAGGIIGALGSIALIVGVADASSNTVSNKTPGWIAAGAGLVATITGGYLVLVGQQKIAIATELFNRRNPKTTAGVGITGNGLGLMVKF